MAWSTSYLATSTFLAALTGTSFNLSTDSQKIALFNNTVAPSPDTASQAYNTAPWNAGEVTGGAWSAGGVAISSPNLANTTGQGGMLSYTASNVSQSGTSLTNAFGAIIYDTAHSNDVVVAVYFGGSYSTTSGTFSITWGTANGVTSLVWWILM